ncbi:MAG: FG-GAP repeat protein [Verrucomicrobia bacterium]|nr:FG-GAP repeat protein [Verrucomicrobiota bacterium]
MKIVRSRQPWLAFASYKHSLTGVRSQPADTSVSLERNRHTHGKVFAWQLRLSPTGGGSATRHWTRSPIRRPHRAGCPSPTSRWERRGLLRGGQRHQRLEQEPYGPLDVDPQFTKMNEGPVATDRVLSWSGHFGDYDGDGLMDLVVTGYHQTTGKNTRLYHNEARAGSRPSPPRPWEKPD